MNSSLPFYLKDPPHIRAILGACRAMSREDRFKRFVVDTLEDNGGKEAKTPQKKLTISQLST